MPYHLSEIAEFDLECVFLEGIELFGEIQALRYHDSFHRTFELLAFMPSIGRQSERNIPGEKRFVHGSHVIYYRIEPEAIVIQSIVYGPAIANIWG